jgi:hypothetical protein
MKWRMIWPSTVDGLASLFSLDQILYTSFIVKTVFSHTIFFSLRENRHESIYASTTTIRIAITTTFDLNYRGLVFSSFDKDS